VNRITLAPTTLPSAPPLEFIAAAKNAGYQGLGLRLHKSPAYPNWVNWLDDEPLKRDVKRALADSGQEMVETLSYYLTPDIDLDEMAPSLQYAAELGATYALVIGRDEDWTRERENFGRFCDLAAQFNLIAAIEAPVGTLSPVANAFRVIDEVGCANGVVCIDPTAFLRAGDTPETLAQFDPNRMPYTQLNDGLRERSPRMRPGDGEANLNAFLDALPPNIPLSLEWPPPADSNYTAEEWARFAIEGTQRFLRDRESIGEVQHA
jgi:sugar phosphate isomerase/epimerase